MGTAYTRRWHDFVESWVGKLGIWRRLQKWVQLVKNLGIFLLMESNGNVFSQNEWHKNLIRKYFKKRNPWWLFDRGPWSEKRWESSYWGSGQKRELVSIDGWGLWDGLGQTHHREYKWNLQNEVSGADREGWFVSKISLVALIQTAKVENNAGVCVCLCVCLCVCVFKPHIGNPYIQAGLKAMMRSFGGCWVEAPKGIRWLLLTCSSPDIVTWYFQYLKIWNTVSCFAKAFYNSAILQLKIVANH